MLRSYAKIYQVGHRAVQDIFKEPIIVEEKIDGSQFSFGAFLDNTENPDTDSNRIVLRCRSKGCNLVTEAPPKLFANAVATVRDLFDREQLHEGWTYRGEAMQSKQHNTLMYDRAPKGGIILYDVDAGLEKYLTRAEKEQEAQRLGLEIVPVLYSGMIDKPEDLRKLLDTTSCLGGQKIEGVVIKNYARFGVDGHCLMCKLVSEEFKEVHNSSWKEREPSQIGIVDRLIEQYKTPARWNKAIQHLRDAGTLAFEPKDIPLVMKEASSDLHEESHEEIKDALFGWAWPKIQRACQHGLAEHYKEYLLRRQFESK